MEVPIREFTATIFLFLPLVLSLSSPPPNDSTQSSLCHPSQSFALLQFKNNLAIDEFASESCDESEITTPPKTASWREGTDCCLWEGVECDEFSGNVIRLDLSCSWLNGTIPANSTLFQLSHLQALNLADNSFYGSVSSEFGRLVNLTHLNLSWSGFSGMIPSQISYLSKLVSLDISDNLDLILDSPTFEMMSENMTHLKHLSLDYVNLLAVDPKKFLNLSASLESLTLLECQLRGKFPVNVFHFLYLKLLKLPTNPELIVTLPKSNWSGPLEMLDLATTTLSRELPYSDVNLNSLKSLVLENCGLVGSVPNFIWNLTQITDLNLRDNNISGEIPTFFSNLQRLTSLSLSFNNLKGQVPDLFENLTMLTYLQLVRNNLEGHLPSSIFSHSQLSMLDLQNNQLVSLPSTVSRLSRLTELSLNDNKLNGTLPSWLFNMPSLEDLDLSDNLLTGQIPDFIFKSLKFLRLGQNVLHGGIPKTITNLVNLTILDLNSNKINGTIPPLLFSLPILEVDLQNNKLTGEIPEFQSKSIERIYLGGNMLHGRIPQSMVQLTNLTVLDLSSNSLFFGIKELSRLQKLKNLRELNLSYTNISIPNTNTVDLNWTCLEVLYLSSCHISGGFPNFLRTQNMLQILDLSNNNIRGEIPIWLQNVGNQTMNILNLSHNHLTGIIQLPWETLEVVDLSSNEFRGSLPVVPSSMFFFSVSNNSLSGNVPSGICDSTFLEVLDLSHNNFSGKFPPCLGNFSHILTVLNLHKNHFEGTIDLIFSEECNLRNLNLQGNKLKGSIAKSVANCKELEVLDLGNNMLNDTFPSWLGTLQELQILILRSNKLYGSIPELSTNDSFPKMLVLDLSNNRFTGHFPASFMKNLKAMINVVGADTTDSIYLGTTTGSFYIPRADLLSSSHYDYSMTTNIKGVELEIQKIFHVFVSMDFSSNKFHGEIPDDLGQLHLLRGLNLSHNSLTGHIPPSIGNLTNLEWLDLSSNKLVGGIPKQLIAVTSLAILNLSYNQLTGDVSEGGQFNTFTADSYRGNLGLCGNPLPKKCKDEELEPPVPSLEVVSNNSCFFEHGFGWQAIAIGYGCGMLIGVGGGYIMYRYRRPQWLLLIIEEKLRLRPQRTRNSRRSRARRN